MRSLAEVAFRARQEAVNLYLLAAQPSLSASAPTRLNLPDPHAVAGALRGSDFASDLESTARQILEHRFPLLGRIIDTGPEIRWRRDYTHNRESSTAYFRRVPYLSFDAVGDHKFIWELNRHQHLVLLAQAFVLSGEAAYIGEIVAQLESWFEQNPFQRGINWASALEVAFRSVSWIWIYHLIGPEMPDSFRRSFLDGLYRHGLHLAENLSIYFSPNTHLLGEAVALHALGALFPDFPESLKWRSRGAALVKAQLDFQVRSDGSHFEQSTYYHVYALDLFLFFYVLAGHPAEFRSALASMAEYLYWLLGPARRITFFGDDDGGRFFYPYGERDCFGRATLAAAGILFDQEDWVGSNRDLAEQAAWWLGPESLRRAALPASRPAGSRLFRDSGTAFLQSDRLFVQIDAGPFGFGGAGHSHADTLSLVVWFAGKRVFIDPGTYTYVGDSQERNWFRGTPAHNTVCIDGHDQAQPAGPFRWGSKPEVNVNAWTPDAQGGLLDATCRYLEFTHRRRVLLRTDSLLVFDEIEGLGEHHCEQIWQLGPAAANVGLSFSAPIRTVESKVSPIFGMKCRSQALVAALKGNLPLQMAMLLQVGGRRSISIDDARRMLKDEHSQLS